MLPAHDRCNLPASWVLERYEIECCRKTMASLSSHWLSLDATTAGNAASASGRVSNTDLDSQTATMLLGPLPFKYSRTVNLNPKSGMYFVVPSGAGPDSTVGDTDSSRTLTITGDTRILSSSDIGPL